MSPVSPPRTLPGVWLKVSQTDGPRPSAVAPPSIWYAAVAAPQTKPAGNVRTASPEPLVSVAVIFFLSVLAVNGRRPPSRSPEGAGRGPVELGYDFGCRCRTTISFCGEPGCPISYGFEAEGQPVKPDELYSSNAAPYTVGMTGRSVATYVSIGA